MALWLLPKYLSRLFTERPTSTILDVLETLFILMQKDQKHQTDEEFELLLKQFIDDALDSDDEPTPVEPELPFPKEIREANDLAAHFIRAGRYAVTTFAVAGLYPMLFNVIDKKLDKRKTLKEDTKEE